jgi:DNA-binding XRE family transcriptional regulator
MKPKPETIAEALYQRRKRLGWEITQAARYLGVAAHSYDCYEKGIDEPAGRLVFPIACFLRSSVNDVLVLMFGYEPLVPVVMAMIRAREPGGAHYYDLRSTNAMLRPKDAEGALSAAMATGNIEQSREGSFLVWRVKKKCTVPRPRKSGHLRRCKPGLLK